MGNLKRIISAAKSGFSNFTNAGGSRAGTANSQTLFRIEQLEPRLLLSADVLPQAAVAAASQVQVNPEPAAIVEQLPADASVSVSIPASQSSAPPTEGQQLDIAYNAANGEILVADNQQIQRIDPTTHDVIASFDIPGSDFTGSLGMQILPAPIPSLGGSAVASGSLLVTNGTASSDKIIALDPDSGARLAVLDLARDIDPVAGAFHAGRGTLFLLDGVRDRIVEINPADGAMVNEFATPMAIGAGGLAIHPLTGNLWIGSNQSNLLAEITPTGSVVNLVDGSALGLNFNVSGLAFKNGFDLLVGTTQGDVLQIHDPRVDMPQDLNATAGTTITVPIRIDNTEGIVGIEIGGSAFDGQPGISYDTALLTVTGVWPGSVIAEGSDFVANVDETAGTIKISVSFPEGVAQPNGTIALIDFQINATTPSTTTRVNLQRVSLLNGTVSPIAVIPEPEVGVDESDGIITITALDTDSDGVFDIVESGDGNKDGIPDAQQANVATLESFTGNQPVTLMGPSGTSFKNVSAIAVPPGAPTTVLFPLGFFDWSLEGVTPGGTAAVQLLLPPTIDPNTYQKYGPDVGNATAHFSEFFYNGITGAQFADDVNIGTLAAPFLVDRVTLTLIDGGRGDGDLSANGVIDDPGGPGVFEYLSVSDVTVVEGDNGTVNATFTLSLSAPSSQTITVEAATADGSASAGVDYAALLATPVIFAPGITTQQITVPVIGDLLNEIDESFLVLLSNPNNALILDGLGLGTIINDDPLPSLSVGDVTLAEGTSLAGFTNFDFIISLSQASGRTVTVNVVTVDSSAVAPEDYAAIAINTVTFLPGETAKTVTVQVRQDELQESNELFSVFLSNPTNATIVDNSADGTIVNDDGPDLVVTDMQTPSAAAVNSTVSLSWTVANQGGLEAPADWYDAVYLSRNDSYDAGDILLGYFLTADKTPLSAGASYAIDGQVTLPTVEAGNWYLLVKADEFNYQAETNEGNNLRAAALEIVAPDLVVTNVQAPSAAVVGSTVSLTWTVSNQETFEAPADWVDYLLLSQDQIFDGNDVYVDFVSTGDQTPLAAGASYTIDRQVTIPNPYGSGNVLAGTWYLLVGTDFYNNQGETNETNNLWVQAIEIGAPDLVVTDMQAPAAAVVNSTLSLSWTVTNQSGVEAPAIWLDYLFLSRDPLFDGGDSAISATFAGPLAAGASYTFTPNVTIPNVEAGAWYLLFVTDPFNYQSETNENNNLWVQAIEISAPDLVVTNVQAPATAVMGSTVPVSWTVTNQSTSEAPADWSDYVFLSIDQILDPADSFIDGVYISAQTPVPAGGNYTATRNILMPNVEAGSWYFLVRTDHWNEQGETDETNNSAAAAIALEVNLSPAGTDKTVTIAEDTAYPFSAADFGFTDPNSVDGLSAVRVDSLALPLGATLTLFGSPVSAQRVIAALDIPGLLFTPASNSNGDNYASFTFSVADGASGFDPAPNSFAFNVTAVNDAPVVNFATYLIAENSSNGVTVGMVTAVDPDTSDPLSFAITSGNIAEAFLIDSTTGAITVANSAALDFEATRSFILTVEALDNGMPALSGSNALIVNLSDVNEAPVVNAATITLAENSAIDTAVGSATAIDPDDGTVLTYSIIGGDTDGAFAIDAGTGAITVANSAALDFETTPQFLLAVQALDNGVPALTGTNTITVNLTDINEAPVVNAATFSLAENSANGTAVGIVTATDPDAGATLSYSIIGGNTDGAFAIDAGTGAITVANSAALDFEIMPRFDLTVQALDNGVPSSSGSNSVTVNLTNVNEAPIANDDSTTTNEDTAIIINVLANDTDPENDTLAVIAVTQGSNGSVAINPDGTIKYTPAANFNGSDSFTYLASDGQANSNVATVSITINAVNDAPVAADDSYNVDEDTTLPVNVPRVLGNDSDVDGDALTAALVSGPTNGVLGFNPDGSFSYTPNANFNGSDSFSYHVTDGTSPSNVAAVTITVNPVNDAPVAASENFSTSEDIPLVVAPAQGVLVNDSDIDGDLLRAVVVSAPSHGTLALAEDGSFTYTPAPNYNGNDSFTYKANDGQADSNSVTVAISIAAVNDAPVAHNDAYSVNEDSVMSIRAAQGTLANDSDVEGNPLRAILVSGPSHGVASLRSDGSFFYIPTGNFNGSDSFTYKTNDGQADSTVATVAITVNGVNDAPVAQKDAYSVNEDTLLDILSQGVLANDSDLDGNLLTAALVSGPSHGALSLNANGSFSYMPAANYYGLDSFTYRAYDGVTNSPTVTATIAVKAVNDSPAVQNDVYSVGEDGILIVANSQGVLANDSDAEGSALRAALLSSPSHGMVALRADGSFFYVPNANFNGSDSFTYKTNDGLTDSSPATVTITVNAVNDAPVAGADSYSVDEDVTLSVAAAGVLGNDSDVDGDTLTALLVSGPAHGTLTLNNNGSFNYTPNTNYHGGDSFTYKAGDGIAQSNNIVTVSLTVNSVNDAPVAGNDVYLIGADGLLIIPTAQGVLSNDSDVDGILRAILLTGPAHGVLVLRDDGSFVYVADEGFNGADGFIYAASDGSSVAPATVVINHRPVAVDNAYSVDEDNTLTVSAPGLIGNDIDTDGDALTAALVAGPAHGSLTFNNDGSFSYTPALNYNGSDGFSYRVSDGYVESNVATVALTVNPVNDAPVAVNDSYSTNEDSALTVAAAQGVLVNDSDVEGDALSALLVVGPTHGTLALGANGSFTYTPALNYNGSDSFSYKANDGQADSNIASVSITINPVNDAPVAATDMFSVNEDSTLTIGAPGVLANDSDVESDLLNVLLVAAPTHGILTLDANGAFTYTPELNYNGSDSFTYKANDGQADSNIATVTITINPVNDAPVAAGDAYSVDEDGVLTIPSVQGALANDTDVESDALRAALVDGPAHGVLALQSNGSVVYVPNTNFNGTDNFSYKANDGQADSNIATVTITVNSVNDAPVAAGDSFSVNEDEPLTVNAPGILANDTDVDGNLLQTALLAGPAHGTLALQLNGGFIYQADANYNGSDSFSYKATDGMADSNVATVNITIAPVNDAPVALDNAFSVDEEGTLNIAAAQGVLGNDSDVEGQALQASLVDGPTHGVLVLQSNGAFVYQPNGNFSGSESFTYKANDGQADSNIATVTITVNPVNDAPVAADDAFSVNEDEILPVIAPGVLGNDTDVDGVALQALLITGPAHGVLALQANGGFVYQADANFNGSDSFTYKVNDGMAESNVATVNITIASVNDAPVASADAYLLDKDGVLTIPVAQGVLANDSDVDGDAITAVQLTDPAHGIAVINPDGSLIYVPDAGFVGTDSLTYKATDGSLDSAATVVSITVADNATITAGAQANDGNPDVFTIVRNGENLEIRLNGLALSSIPLAGAAQFTVKGSDDDDKLVIDFSGGNPIPVAGIMFDGGGPGDEDTLEISGGSFTTVTANFINGSDGSIDLDGSVVSYTGLEPVLLNVDSAANMVFNLPASAGDDAILEDDINGLAGVSQIRSLNGIARFETTTFTNPTNSLTINLAGGDTLRLGQTDLTFAPVSGVTVQGDGANDAIFVTSTSVGVAYTVNAAGGSDVINVGDGLHFLDGIVTVNAGDGDDVINVGDGNLDTILTQLKVFGEDGNDQVNVNDQGIDFDDTYIITASTLTRPFFAGLTYGTVEGLTLNGQTGFGAPNTIIIESTAAGTPVTVNTGDGNDVILVSGANLAAPVTLAGGAETSVPPGDTLNFDAGGNPVTSDANSIAASGSATVTHSGIETVNVANSGGEPPPLPV